MSKHAYLILAHTNIPQLAVLLSMLDYDKNDIFVHIDAKQKEYDKSMLQSAVKKSSLYLLDNPISVEWGQYSGIEVKLKILEEAVCHGPYSFYHLISGTDLPIKPQKQIHIFFDKHTGKEFIHFEYGKHDYSYRYKYYYDFLKDRPRPTSKLDKGLIRLRASMQALAGIDRTKKYPDIVFRKGSNWFSITDAFAKELLAYMDWIFEAFHSTYCADECVVQTIAYNTSFRDAVYDMGENSDQHAIMRMIDWQRGHPYVFRSTDFDQLVHSDYLFARKFDMNVDSDIIYKIRDYILSEQ